MGTMKKYTNIEKEFPKLPRVLQDAIQSEFLDIKRLDCGCNKYTWACRAFPELDNAAYVVFSPFIKRSDHRYETFVFVDKYGEIVCHVSGNDMELYGLLKPCLHLSLSEEYVNQEYEAGKERITG